MKKITLGDIICCECLTDEVDKHIVDSCLINTYENVYAGFNSVDDFWKFLKEHWNDKIKYTLPDCVKCVTDNVMFEFIFKVADKELALYFWDDETYDEIREERGDDFAESMDDEFIMLFFEKLFARYIYDNPRLIEG